MSSSSSKTHPVQETAESITARTPGGDLPVGIQCTDNEFDDGLSEARTIVSGTTIATTRTVFVHDKKPSGSQPKVLPSQLGDLAENDVKFSHSEKKDCDAGVTPVPSTSRKHCLKAVGQDSGVSLEVNDPSCLHPRPVAFQNTATNQTGPYPKQKGNAQTTTVSSLDSNLSNPNDPQQENFKDDHVKLPNIISNSQQIPLNPPTLLEQEDGVGSSGGPSNTSSTAEPNIASTSIEPKQQLLRKLSCHINTKWSLLARYLGVTEEEIAWIKGRAAEPKDRAYQTLCLLMEKGIMWQQLHHGILNKIHLQIAASALAGFAGISQEENPLAKFSSAHISLKDANHVSVLMEVSKSVSGHWKQLAAEVDFSQCATKYSIHQIAYNYEDKVECCNEMLVEWICARESTGRETPTFGELLTAVECTLYDPNLIKTIQEIMTV
jgi:hypothetical protein